MKVTTEGLAAAVGAELNLYSDDVLDALDAATFDVANETCGEIKANAKNRFKGRKYWRSWTVTKQSKKGGVSRIVHAKAPYYRLTHLLENGHAKVNGGYVAGRPHIAGPAEKAEERLVGKLTERIGQI